jgi:hypothetical protein
MSENKNINQNQFVCLFFLIKINFDFEYLELKSILI